MAGRHGGRALSGAGGICCQLAVRAPLHARNEGRSARPARRRMERCRAPHAYDRSGGAEGRMIDQAWREVMRDADRLRPITLAELFERYLSRFERFSLKDSGLLIDFSKEKIDEDSLASLLELARAARVEERRDAMFRGEKINATEGRAALHMALRSGAGERVLVDGEDVMPAVREELGRFLDFAEAGRAGDVTTVSGDSFTDVVNLGIGGSDLGPAMAVQALAPCREGPRVHFGSNVA